MSAGCRWARSITRYGRTAVLIAGFLGAVPHIACAAGATLEDSLAGVTIGISADDLLTQYPNLRRSARPSVGIVQYEGCHHKSSEVFTFIQQSSQELITAIWIHGPESPKDCSDDPVGLPDVELSAVTPRGIRLGDSTAQVMERYGKPDRKKTLADGKNMLEYRSKIGDDGVLNDVRLYFRLSGGGVADMTLSAGLSVKPKKTNR